MDLKFIPSSVCCLLLLLFFGVSPVVNSLEAVQVANFEKGIFSITPYYDGHSDTIFLFGGRTSLYEMTPNNDIFSFSFSNHTLEKIGEIPSNVSFHNNIDVFPSSNGSHLLYLVNVKLQNLTLVFKFDPLDGSSTQVGEIPLGFDLSTFTTAPNGDIYVLGGYYFPQTILRLDLESETISYEVIGSFRESFEATSCTKVGKNEAFFFGETYENPNRLRYVVLDLETLESSDVHVLSTFFDRSPELTSTGRDEIILIGGYGAESILSGLIQINATTHVRDFLHVDNFPLPLGSYYSTAPSPIYVEKLNRIYFFGGLLYPFLHETRIWYISLNETL